jgi:hypothetical protein
VLKNSVTGDRCRSGDQVVDDITVDVGQPEVLPTVAKSQPGVVDSHQVRDGGSAPHPVI